MEHRKRISEARKNAVKPNTVFDWLAKCKHKQTERRSIELGTVDEWCTRCGTVIGTWPIDQAPEPLPIVGMLDRRCATRKLTNKFTLAADELPVGKMMFWRYIGNPPRRDWLHEPLKPKQFSMESANGITKVRRIA